MHVKSAPYPGLTDAVAEIGDRIIIDRIIENIVFFIEFSLLIYLIVGSIKALDTKSPPQVVTEATHTRFHVRPTKHPMMGSLLLSRTLAMPLISQRVRPIYSIWFYYVALYGNIQALGGQKVSDFVAFCVLLWNLTLKVSLFVTFCDNLP
ncbi:MAG: hypothetical protein PHD31_00120 [Candidatus Pacebacteria bacterium]|nr:hypothetical protein [Candidatus Paceibacterota bacterium]